MTDIGNPLSIGRPTELCVVIWVVYKRPCSPKSFGTLHEPYLWDIWAICRKIFEGEQFSIGRGLRTKFRDRAERKLTSVGYFPFSAYFAWIPSGECRNNDNTNSGNSDERIGL